MSEANPLRIFVSHNFAEGDDYLRLFEFLESMEQFFYVNVSDPENIPTLGGLEAIKEELVKQIKASEIVILVPELYEATAAPIQFMMEVAEANSIRMIALRPYGGLSDIPGEIVNRVKALVDWNARMIVDSILQVARGEETSRWEVLDFPGFEPDVSNE
jgi:hypothetical protein